MFFAAYFWIETFTDLCLVKCFLDLLSDLSSCKNCLFTMLYFSTSFLPVSLIYIYWELDIPVPSERPELSREKLSFEVVDKNLKCVSIHQFC